MSFYKWFLTSVNPRVFGAYTHKKILFEPSHYAKAVRHEKTGGFFAWIAGREEKNSNKLLAQNLCNIHVIKKSPANLPRVVKT